MKRKWNGWKNSDEETAADKLKTLLKNIIKKIKEHY
jgi:hypothetical protein